VGLTLKRHDAEKETKYWMADYRFMSYPGFNAKMKDFTILAMLKQGLRTPQVMQLTGAKMAKVEDLKKAYEEGRALAESSSKTIR
jgi:hypothetical protein